MSALQMKMRRIVFGGFPLHHPQLALQAPKAVAFLTCGEEKSGKRG